ncbi:MAG: GNAT family N-acetyltransferase [Paucibacter sp.]|nr:GNAT family N-acetyltransferase [Roseateles sp.]
MSAAPDYSLMHASSFSTTQWSRDIARAEAHGESQRMYAAFEREDPVALIHVLLNNPLPEVATISGLLVNQSSRRRHVGCRAIEALSRQARSWPGITRWSLHVFERNTAALAFWLHCGFDAVQCQPRADDPNGTMLMLGRTLKGKPLCRCRGVTAKDKLREITSHNLVMLW